LVASTRLGLALFLLLVCGLVRAQGAGAPPPDMRLDPQERDRLRHELRQQGAGERYRSPERRGYGSGERSGAPTGDGPAGDRGGRAPYPYGAAAPRGGEPRWDPGTAGGRGGFAPPGAPRERMSAEDRQQLRMLLRERHRSSRD
jgi:hypothetical protein